MCDKASLRDIIWTKPECKECVIKKYEDPKIFCADGCIKIDPPKTAYELLMEKKRRYEKKKLDVTMWFTDDKCKECGFDIYTDGKLYWCSENCLQSGKRGVKDREGFGFINDLIR